MDEEIDNLSPAQLAVLSSRLREMKPQMTARDVAQVAATGGMSSARSTKRKSYRRRGDAVSAPDGIGADQAVRQRGEAGGGNGSEVVPETARQELDEMALANMSEGEVDSLLSMLLASGEVSTPAEAVTTSIMHGGNEIMANEEKAAPDTVDSYALQNKIAAANNRYMMALQLAWMPDDVRRRIEDAQKEYIYTIKQSYAGLDLNRADTDTVELANNCRRMADSLSAFWGVSEE